MTIKAHAGPLNGRLVMQQALSARMPQARAFSTPLGGAPQAGSPIPAYHLSLENFNTTNPLESASITSWRYPVIGGIHPGLADIRSNGTDTSFGGLSQGILAQRFIQASILADQLLGSDSEEFQPRLLDAPSVQFAALWLHSDNKDYFISLLDGRPPGTAPLALSNDVIPELRARASARQQGQAVPLGGTGPGSTPTN